MVVESNEQAIKTIENDIDELREIIKSVKSDNIKKDFNLILRNYVGNLEKKKIAASKSSSGDAKNVSSNPVTIFYKTLSNYSCSFSDKMTKVSIDVPVEVIPDSFTKEINKKSIKITIKGVNKTHYKFTCSELADEIKPEEFKYKISENKKKIFLYLYQLVPVAWKALSSKEIKQKSSKQTSDKDMSQMNAQMMQMMSSLYDKAGPEEKEKISEAFAKTMESSRNQ